LWSNTVSLLNTKYIMSTYSVKLYYVYILGRTTKTYTSIIKNRTFFKLKQLVLYNLCTVKKVLPWHLCRIIVIALFTADFTPNHWSTLKTVCPSTIHLSRWSSKFFNRHRVFEVFNIVKMISKHIFMWSVIVFSLVQVSFS